MIDASTMPQGAGVAQPPSVDDLVRETLRLLPSMNQVIQHLRDVMTVFVTYVGRSDIPVIKVTPQEALEELELTQGLTQANIIESCEEMMSKLEEALVSIHQEFDELTGTTTDPVDFEAFRTRFESERGEQASLVASATALLEMVKTIAGALGIPNPDPALQPTVAPITEKAGLLTNLKVLGLRGVSVFVESADDTNSNKNEPRVMPGWLTEPIMDANARELKLLKMISNKLTTTPDVALVSQHLQKLKIDRNAVAALLKWGVENARHQLEQSKSITDATQIDYQRFEKRLAGCQDLRSILLDVRGFIDTK